jgi:predicted transcriptional regulator
LTDGEVRIMRVLWDLERATVSDVVDRLHQAGPNVPAYNTVLTMLRILERKGYVRHRKDGRAFTFEPIVDRRLARKSALANLLNKFFDGSPTLLVLDLVSEDAVDARKLDQLRALLHESSAPADRRKRRRWS